ncbi:hypothetical protein LguiB_008846 [Lonicera macranthoides]
MNLSGDIPDELKFCRSLQTLDLSNNSLNGTIPSQICTWMPFLVSLDLSNNHLTGSIPDDLVSCQYLNAIVLDDNRLTGAIPYQLSTLSRLKRFSVANNELSGRVPSEFERIDSDFGGNSGLCGGPLRKCGSLSKKNLAIIIAAVVLDVAALLLLGFWLHSPQNFIYLNGWSSSKRKREIGVDLNGPVKVR